MTKRIGFDNDLEAVTGEVETNVANMIQLLNGDTTNPKLLRENKKDTAMDNDGPTKSFSTTAMTSPSEQNERRRSKHSAHVPTSMLSVSLVNVTTRLRHETNERLTDAALRQRLKKVSPNTRQDIIESALVEWFRRHGYSS